MKINFPFNNLIIPDDYAKNAQVTEFGMAVTSFPFLSLLRSYQMEQNHWPGL